jgi:cytochrome c biogenesis protein CcdA/thiol-disulfide isomerase/thioredoxin
MFLYLLAFIGGILTIVSPCILPVLPFVFSRTGQPFRRSGLPLLAGMALTFALVATVASFAGAWIVRANQWGRYVALAVFAVLGISLLFPSFADYLSRPFVQLGARAQKAGADAPGVGRSILLGVATGLLWAPCAGPILGLILTGAAIGGASLKSLTLLTSFAAGASCSLALILLAGNRVFAALKRSLGAEVWVRRAIGAAVILGVVAIGAGWDTGILARISVGTTASLEQHLIGQVHASAYAMDGNAAPQAAVPLDNEGPMPSLDGAIGWLNSDPLNRESLANKVVVVDFWTYSCINCLREIPYVQAWYDKYKKDGLVVIGVHTPEFAFERDPENVEKAVKSLKITFPVAIDSYETIWKAFRNEYWPATYFIDAKGTIRYHHFAEGDYDKSETVIQELLREKNSGLQLSGYVTVNGAGAQAASDRADEGSPETYIGFARAKDFASPERVQQNSPATYTVPGRLDVNNWGLVGQWTVEGERAVLDAAPGKIVFRFHSRDLHLVLGPSKTGKPIRFRVTLDGTPVGEDAGADVDKSGNGTVREFRLYQLIRQKGKVEDRTFQIEFLDPGVQAFSFTFG